MKFLKKKKNNYILYTVLRKTSKFLDFLDCHKTFNSLSTIISDYSTKAAYILYRYTCFDVAEKKTTSSLIYD